MSTHITAYRRHGLAIVLAALVCVTAGTAAAGPPPKPGSPLEGLSSVPGCIASPRNAEACSVVSRFFEHAEHRRYAAACSLLGARLLYESGGSRCHASFSSAYFAGSHSWALAGTRPTEAVVGVLVRVAMPELGHVRRRMWLASVAREDGAPKIVSTRLVG